MSLWRAAFQHIHILFWVSIFCYSNTVFPLLFLSWFSVGYIAWTYQESGLRLNKKAKTQHKDLASWAREKFPLWWVQPCKASERKPNIFNSQGASQRIRAELLLSELSHSETSAWPSVSQHPQGVDTSEEPISLITVCPRSAPGCRS